VRGREFAGSTGLAATRRNLNVARTIEAQKRLDAEHGIEPEEVLGIPFPVAVAEFLTWCHSTCYRNKPSTARRISTSFASLSEFFRAHSVEDIRAIEIERYKTWRAENFIKDVTLRNDLNALSLFFKYAKKAGWATINPLIGEDKVKRPSGEDAVRINVISFEDELKYFAAMRLTRGKLHNLYDVAKLMVLQGCRPEKIMSLKKSNYDAPRGELRIEGGKSKAAKRTLYLCGESIQILNRRMKLEGHWVFPSDRIPGDHIRQLQTTHDSVCQDAGVNFVIYDLRHTFATRFVEAGGDLVTLKDILGHSSLRSVIKYVHPTAQHQREGMKRYEASRPVASLKVVKG
jgi:integrase